MVFRVGLTGGVGSGKTAVARLFSHRGVPVIDTDELARELVRPGSEALLELVATFGADVLRDGELDRRRLRDQIFSDDRLRIELEAILHPRIYRELAQRVALLDTPYAVLVIPLLIEGGRPDVVDRVLVVDCPVDVQVRRVMVRDGATEAAVRRIIDRQVSRATRLAAADDLIRNDGTLDDLVDQVDRIHSRYAEFGAAFARGPDRKHPSY